MKFHISFQMIIFVCIFFLAGTIVVPAQLLSGTPPETSGDTSQNFYQIQKTMNDYWGSKQVKGGSAFENGRNEKVAEWKLYKRWEYYWEQRINAETGDFPKTNSAIEYQKYLESQKNLKKTNSYGENWVNLGTNTSAGGYAGLGRINCVAFHPSDNNTFWVGSPSGGIWKTTNGGSSWTVLNDNQTVLGVSDIAIPFNYAATNTLYIATGDRDGGSVWSLGGGQGADNNSIGVLKSTDGGSTWNSTGLSYATSLNKKVYRLLIHPTNASVLLASTTDGIYKSTDAGATWALKSSSNRYRDMQFKPGDPTIIYAGRVSGNPTYVAKSTNTGDTWTNKTINGVTTHYTSQIRLAVSDNNPALVYVALQDGKIYKSTDYGENYSKVSTNDTQNMLGYYSDGSGTASQASYDLCLACSPADANTVFFGSINNWKSTDGGVTWAATNLWLASPPYNTNGCQEVHADKHILAYQNSSTLFEGNDGGIYKTTDGGTTWTDLTNGLIISQVYRIGVSQTNPNVVLAGLQDNGSKKYTGGANTWFDATGGDGMECIVDFTSATSYMYATYVQGTIYRNSNGFSTTATSTISANIPGGQPTGAWVTPYIMDPTNSATIFAGFDKVWKTTDRGNTWTSASQVLSATTKLRSLAIAPSNTNTLYAADLTALWKTTDGGATNWSAVSLPTTLSNVTSVTVKYTDANTIWITYGGYTDGTKIYESTNGGSSWSNISTGLPNLPVMNLIHYKSVTDRTVLMAATDVGVYIKDGANNWTSFSSGLPNVMVTELDVYYGAPADRIRAATYGRGMWETEIISPLPVELTALTASVKENAVVLNWTTETEISNFGFRIERKKKDTENTRWESVGFVHGHGNSNSQNHYRFEDKSIPAGVYMYRLVQIDNDGQFKYIGTVEVNFSSMPSKYELRQNYPNPFNPVTNISYSVKEQGMVQLKVYDLLGSEVRTMANELKQPGNYSVQFDAKDLPSGVYIYRLQVNGIILEKKMALIK